MNQIELIQIVEQLEQIDKKIDGKFSYRYLSINQVANLTSLSTSTIRRAINKGQLKCSKKLGKLLFLESDINNWLKS
jgi:excisionase family DNA binding protein